MKTIAALEDKLSTPSSALIEDIKKIKGDILILGLGGKMGPSLAKLAKRAIDAAGINKKIIGVSRFSNASLYDELSAFGIECLRVDLLDDAKLQSLPNVENVIYMAGNKFGTTRNESHTWAMNVYLPGRVAQKFQHSNIVAFSTGNVYPLVNYQSGGATESTAPAPIGEYAQSCLGRERMFEYFSKRYQTPVLLFRLNYALDLRYGILTEVAKSVWEGNTIDLKMGYVNVIWQGDANSYAIRSLLHCSSPANILNVTGPETIAVKELATRFGEIFNKPPTFQNEAQATALLNNSTKAHQLFGLPKVSLEEMIQLTANWIMQDGPLLNKPTHFQERKGAF